MSNTMLLCLWIIPQVFIFIVLLCAVCAGTKSPNTTTIYRYIVINLIPINLFQYHPPSSMY